MVSLNTLASDFHSMLTINSCNFSVSRTRVKQSKNLKRLKTVHPTKSESDEAPSIPCKEQVSKQASIALSYKKLLFSVTKKN